MKRPLFPAFVAIFAGLAGSAVALLSAGGCDPNLAIQSVPGEGGTSSEASAGDASKPVAPTDSGPPSEAGADAQSEAGVDSGPPEHVIDGTNDFAAGEKFATTSASYEGYVSWDADKVYFGMAGADVGSGSATHWVLVYVDGNPGNAGTPTGISYDCSGGCAAQAANLPFSAGFHYRWKADGMYSDLQKYNGTAWVDVGQIKTFGQKGPFMEVSLTRAVLGNPTKLKVHMTMLIEQSGAEWTYSGVPSTSFTDGKAPAAFTKYFEFDLSDTAKAPNTYATLP